MKPNVIAIIQARMGASRLPGKVLKDIAGQPMLLRVVERTKRAQMINKVIVATTVDPADEPVVEYCTQRGIPVYRGSLPDVLDRYYQAAKQFAADVIVRVTADCPVIDPQLVDDVVALLLEHDLDFIANRLPPPFTRSYPIGLDVEACTFAALERAWQEADQTFQREHVMPYLYEEAQLSFRTQTLAVGSSPRGFKLAQCHHVPDHGALRWTVDTPQDLLLLNRIYEWFDGEDHFSWREILSMFERDPALAAINAETTHKNLYDVDERHRG